MPVACDAMPILPLSSAPSATLSPRPGFPSTLRAGTSQSSRIISTVFEERRPIFFSSLPARKPLVVKLLGNRQEEAWAILEAENVPVVKVVRTEDAAQQLAALVGEVAR